MITTAALEKVHIRVDKEQLGELCQQNDVIYLGVFGSVARGEANQNSDIDLLVRFRKPKSLLSVIAFEDQLATFFSRRVDLLTDSALSPYIRDNVLSDVRVLYEP